MSNLDPFERIAKLDQQSSHSGAVRKSQGITYTPPFVAREMVGMLKPGESETILEPSCGRGVFIFALLEYWRGAGKSFAWIDQWAQKHLFACDLDGQAVADLQQLWEEYFLAHGHRAHPINAQVEDGLFGPWSTRRFDVIVGNPPYVRIQNLAEEVRGQIRGKYSSCAKGNVDLYYAFIEDALERAGRVCLITPNSWLTNDSASRLRQIILPRLDKLIDFQARLMFAPVRAYTSILLAREKVGGAVMVRNNLPHEGGAWKSVGRDQDCWGRKFTPLAEKAVETGVKLGEQFEVLSGIATLSDKSYILPSPRVEGGVVYQVDDLDEGREISVPKKYAPRFVKITKPGKLDQGGPRIIYPYENGSIVDEQRLAQEAPGLLSWLERRREQLDARDKGKTQGYDAWYAYGRKQGLWTCREEKMILLPTMGNGKLAPVVVNASQICPFLFVSGYVIRAKGKACIDELAEYLSGQRAWEYVKREGKAWAGAGDYRTLGARALRGMPLPEGLTNKLLHYGS